MSSDGFPSHERLFGDPAIRAEDAARSVHSPAAYLVELLRLLEGTFERPALLERRPDLEQVVLDGENTYIESPYLDIVNEILERLVGDDPYGALRTRTHPLGLPFSLRNERLKKYLDYFEVTPDELYLLFTSRIDHDILAREYLGLSPEDVTALTTVLDEAGLAETLGLEPGETLAVLEDAARFAAATGLTGAELRALVEAGTGVTLEADGSRLQGADTAWFERTTRLVRLMRLTAMAPADLSLVVDTCCAGRIDLAGLRAVAAAVRLGRVHGMAPDEVCGLVVPILPEDVEGCSGDILDARNRDYRFRLAAAIDVSESDITEIVLRYRERYSAAEPGPFDHGEIGPPAIGLLRRTGHLARALGLAVAELFDVLTVLEGDPSLHRYTTFTVLGGAVPASGDHHAVLEGGDAAAGLWLAQTLFSVVAWMRENGFGGAELAGILGGGPAPGETREGTSEDVPLEPARAVERAAFAPDLFLSGRFGERAAEVVYYVLTAYDDGVVSPLDDRLLRLDRARVDEAAYDAVTDLGVPAAEDFMGQGLGDRLAQKIYGNLVHRGLLRADGTILADPADEPALAGDFTAHAEALFTLIGTLADGTAALFPSDIAGLNGISDPERDELYENLIYNGHVGQDGDLPRPEFFLDPGNLPEFAVNVDLADVREPVLALLEERIARVRTGPLALDPAIFADLRLTPEATESLLESLRFGGHLDQENTYLDAEALLALDARELGLALEFYPRRRAVLAAMQRQISEFRTASRTLAPDDFADLADEAMGHRALAATDLGPAAPDAAFTQAERYTIEERLDVVAEDARPYRVAPEALTDLGLDAAESDRVLDLLVGQGHLDEDRAVPRDRLAYFRNVNNALEFSLAGLDDYATDIFFILHAVASEISGAVTEIGERLAEQAARQHRALYDALADTLGVPAATAAAICDAVVGGPDQALDLLVAPLLTAGGAEPDAAPADPRPQRCHRRIRRFAMLASKLGLSATEVGVVFRDQDLAGKFPEQLALPPGVQGFDALLESFDGSIYLFVAGGYWTYAADTRALAGPDPEPLTELSAHFADLVAVDAAFTHPAGDEWIIGHGPDGLARAYTRERGGTRWAPREQAWGTVRNAFTDPERIDGAFVDADGRTYLFSGDQYIRYSTGDFGAVDEGYPRGTADWWEHESRGIPLPPRFRTSIDACFQDRDDTVHVFSGTGWLSVGPGEGSTPAEREITDGWGKVRNAFDGAERPDAAYAAGPAVHLLAGDQVLRYSDSIENDGVRADEGYPRLIQDVPPEFAGAVEAAFTDASGALHLFKNGRTVTLPPETGAVPSETGAPPPGTGTPAPQVVSTAERWGGLAPVLPGGTVDAAFVGLDGRTYVFGGTTYLRYSGADYSVVDLGHPRSIARDWGGLDRVDAAFAMDGKTYLFGVGGLLFDLPDEHRAELDQATLSPALVRRFGEYGLTPQSVTGAAPEWTLATREGITLTVRHEGLRVKVFGGGARFHVRYSTRDYRTPDPGYPKPLSDNWWNLPDGLELGPVDAVFSAPDGRTHLFAGERVLTFDARHRWWSRPRPLRDLWGSLPFDRVDAAFVGQDGRTYVFSGDRFARYSTADYTRVDDRYPAAVPHFWGNVVHNVARTGRVDAALVREVTETVDGVEVPRTHTYLFSGDQYVRFAGDDYSAAEDGYPRGIAALSSEPGMEGLDGLDGLAETLDGVDAAFADRRTTYLFRGSRVHAVSSSPYRHYDDPALSEVTCAFIEDGSVMAATPDGWTRRSALEGHAPTAVPYRPRTLRTVPEEYRAGLDAVLTGADGNTYLFRGPSCFNARLNKDYPLAEEWGRPRNAVYEDGTVDAAFVGRDGRTYLFSGDQYVVYDEDASADIGTALIDGDPAPIADAWGGLTSVTLAYVHGERTFVFEKPDATGTMRYVVYSGTGYDEPDEGYPAFTDASFWQVPGGFPIPSAVLFEGDTMLLLGGERCAAYDEASRRWSAPRPLERLWHGFAEGLEPEDTLRSAFTAPDGATYFFFGETYARYHERAFSAQQPIRDRWGLSENPFVPADGTGRVEAAFVWRGERTYLFSGDRYVRYTGADYRYIDPGYPKKTAGNLRREEPFANLPETFEDLLAEPGAIRAVIAGDRTVHVFAADGCHAVSRVPAATLDSASLGRIRNTFADDPKVDASIVTERHTYLFSGDQYIRYTGADRAFVDDGYPKSIGESLPGELGLPALPAEFADGLDAAFRTPDGTTYLFKDRRFLRGDGPPEPVNELWGKVRNAFADGGLDAAFAAPSGELYAFRSGQFVRYRPDDLEHVEEGYPRTVTDDWGDLPPDFEAGPDGAFVLGDRTYLLKGERYVRYSGDGYTKVDRTFPQEIRHRWSGTADYRLSDVHTITRFAGLVRSRGEDLAAFLAAGAEDPYRYLAELFGWDVDQVRWARRNAALLHPETAEESLFEIEFLLRLAELFAAAGRFGAGPAEVFTEVWSRLYRTDEPDAAADALYGMLERRTAPEAWPALDARVHGELNVLRRDALLRALRPLGSPRDLFDRLLIDVEMGAEGATSRVREAMAATQLFLHRYLLDLEEATPLDPSGAPVPEQDDEVRARLRARWPWLKNYRVWEAGRKVFLYPENYLRPELRADRTPAFTALQDDLLQGEITAEAVLASYKRYLDEYTEVSRLSIAGGYVYAEDGAAEGTRRLVMFGRTRTDPRRYYHRAAEFRDGEKLSASWEPWRKVDVQIDAERVHPVHAFGRVFVFWAVVETPAPDDPSRTTIVAEKDGDTQRVSAPQPEPLVRIYYSFMNLNGDWVPAQVLAADAPQPGPISNVNLYVQATRTVPDGPEGDHDSIVVTCTYRVGRPVGRIPVPGVVRSAFTLTPELYGLRSEPQAEPPRTPDLDEVFAEPPSSPIDPSRVVRFNAPAGSSDGPWFSVDHKGGSFLCRPVTAPDTPAPLQALQGNAHNLPTTWDRIDAAFALPDGTLYFFDGTAGRFIATPPGRVSAHQTRRATADRFGVVGTVLNRTGVVDAVLPRGDHIFLFSGPEYYRFPAASFGTLDPGYPKPLDGNTEDLPSWSGIDAALALPDGTEIFYSRERHAFVSSGALDRAWPASERWRPAGRHRVGHIVFAQGRFHLLFGRRYLRLTPDGLADGDLRDLEGNEDGLPTGEPTGPSFPYQGGIITFDNAAGTYVHTVEGDGPGEPRPTRDLGRVRTAITETGAVDAAYLAAGKLYLTSGTEFVRYTLAADGSIPGTVDEGYPRALQRPVDGVFRRDGHHYVLSGDRYARLTDPDEPGAELEYLPIEGNWRALPAGFPGEFTGMLDGDGDLYFFMGASFAAYPTSDAVPRPYELAALPTEIVRLTSSTAFELNRTLLTGGIGALLDPRTQEFDELPAFSTARSDATTIRVGPRVAATALPASSHLDFQSSNGRYYWEIFFHAPLLIAQALNGAQRFEDARRWHEYIFDPAEKGGYWRFLPFLAADVDALVAACRTDLRVLDSAPLAARLEPVLARLEEIAPAFRQERELTATEAGYLAGLAGGGLDEVRAALGDLPAGAGTRRLGERIELIAALRRGYDLLGDRGSMLRAYHEDPFDPHAIAALRPSAHRRAVVMAYIDNLLDWGDLLFRQYTAESIDEARMLYIFAYDLLGERPYDPGPRELPEATSYEHLDEAAGGPGTGGEAGRVTAGGALLESAGAVHEGVAHPYFYVPGNAEFLEYWNRVEDRLGKIRESLDIMGVSRPVPLFEPPADVSALVRGAASGTAPDRVAAAGTAAVPHYRFSYMFRRAQDLADRLQRFGGDLLNTLERRDAEELALLRSRHEAAIQQLTRSVKEAQVEVAVQNLAEARAARDGARERADHFRELIDEGLSPLQRAQISTMALAAAAHFASGGLKIGAAVALGLPQALIGPFIMGTEFGGEQVGESLDKGAEVAEATGEGLSLVGEVLGVRAEQERASQDWTLQLGIARSDVTQLGHQIAAAEQQVALARRELEILDREAGHAEAVTTFLTEKFAGAELFTWMASRLSTLYFQTYGIAYEAARSAERAYLFERGGPGDAGYIQPTYWESRRNGLLAGEGLSLDLERLGQAYVAADTRGLEITKKVSLLALDPIAVLSLRDGGRCEFALTEALFDRDFPGHYRRRIKNVSVAFETDAGQVNLNATLTQLDGRTVLEPDPAAVKFLLDPKGAPPATLRTDWRPGQQIALSDVPEGWENNGLFELRYDDDRYLPFEGTGAVSRWRLETGRPAAGLRDVTVTVRYRADQGGQTFANAVRGMLKPYPAARFFDVAAEFPDAWRNFLADDMNELVLPLAPEMFAGMSGRQITGVYARYDLSGPGGARFSINGEPRLTLADGELLRVPGLSVGGPKWPLVLNGDKGTVNNLGLVLTYRAGAQ
ncbi:hemopexin repeat-containing protein [Actinomadura sp. WMMB 499]|uniref:hemopexin repeat-containing protein n=1 Tax=Actinomadura sp. WMMB 499 TaxID=1219491 RepID=UPI001243BCA5|nr:hemopexin repeat-containing protein [Actinomadura sp. WMMB 499]QFG22230.1 hypothetical protein F7P10_14930 [Actinomadura sp. WMMB 499]